MVGFHLQSLTTLILEDHYQSAEARLRQLIYEVKALVHLAQSQ